MLAGNGGVLTPLSTPTVAPSASARAVGVGVGAPSVSVAPSASRGRERISGREREPIGSRIGVAVLT